MKLRILVQEAEEGGYWAEASSIPGCAIQSDSLEALLENMREAVAGCLSANALVVPTSDADLIIETTV